MKKPKQNYSPEFKSKLVLEALTEEKTPLQIAVENGVHVKSLNKWVADAKQKLPAIFKGEVQEPEVALQKEIDVLHKKIGQLTVENDFLKKASGRWT